MIHVHRINGKIFASLDLVPECMLCSDFITFLRHRENEASLAVLPDLLMELDSMNEVQIVLFILIHHI